MMFDAPIGIFDSGIGGLTVVKEMRRILPKENLIYVGDTARVPYGSREPKEILGFMHQFLNFFRAQKVKMAVFACNTMTAYGYETARRAYPFLLTPMNSGVDEAAVASRGRAIGVIATQGTVNNEMHVKAARQSGVKAEIYAKACPEFVPLIESGVVEGEAIERAAERYMNFFSDKALGALILGCTHYPLIGNIVQKYVGEEVCLINPARATAQDAARCLRDAGIENAGGQGGGLRLCFSSEIAQAQRMAEVVLGTDQAEFAAIDLPGYAGTVE